jgi:hypothetical protein
VSSRSGIDQAGFLLQRAHRRLRMAHNEALAPLGLNIAHVAVLGLLGERGDLPAQLAEGIALNYVGCDGGAASQ